MYSIGAHTAVDVHHKHAVALTAFTFFWEKTKIVTLHFIGFRTTFHKAVVI